jgi:hypothetical protein
VFVIVFSFYLHYFNTCDYIYLVHYFSLMFFFFFYLFASFSAIFRGFTQVFNMVARKVHQLTMNMHKTLLSFFFFLGLWEMNFGQVKTYNSCCLDIFIFKQKAIWAQNARASSTFLKYGHFYWAKCLKQCKRLKTRFITNSLDQRINTACFIIQKIPNNSS